VKNFFYHASILFPQVMVNMVGPVLEHKKFFFLTQLIQVRGTMQGAPGLCMGMICIRPRLCTVLACMRSTIGPLVPAGIKGTLNRYIYSQFLQIQSTCQFRRIVSAWSKKVRGMAIVQAWSVERGAGISYFNI
jgi:hypothetical protein